MRKKHLLTYLLLPLLGLFLSTEALAQSDPIEPDPDLDREIGLNPDANPVAEGVSLDSDYSGTCKYVEEDGKRKLEIDENVFDNRNILMGISDPSKCPLPGSEVFENYPKIAGEFLFSGVVCITQSIILDSMFRVYCSILVWMYQIIEAMIILYLMFYGLAIMLDLSNRPLQEVVKRFLKIVFIFLMATSAQWGFGFVHKGFTNFLSSFSNILTRIQPLYTDGGEAAYALVENEDGEEEWKLLDLNGDVWKKNNAGPGTTPPGYGEVESDENYVSFRLPAQQWFLDSSRDFKLTPVFEEVTNNQSLLDDNIYKACILDLKFNTIDSTLESFHRCHPKGWPVAPNIAPFSTYCTFTDKNSEFPSGCTASANQFMYPPKMHIDSTLENPQLCDEENEPETCRQPFQGILGKIDAMFNSVVGDDNARGLSAMVIALVLWGFGAGVFLAMFLMTGIISMFIAFIQILWTYATSMMALTFLMMLSPLFISFALFKTTERMFRSWLGSLISFALQPILILGFLYVLSSATTLDRLSQLAKHEVGNTTYEFASAGDQRAVRMDAPGFIKPLYEAPGKEFLESLDIAVPETGVVGNLITKSARDKIREDGARRILNKVAAENFSGTTAGGIINPDEAIKLNNDRVLKMKEYFNGETEVKNEEGKITNTLTGAAALKYQFDNGEDFLQPFITEYNNTFGFDDGDSFSGEPPNSDNPEKPRGEFPTCKKYCPGFKPAYNLSEPDTLNPTSSQCVKYCMYSYSSKDEMFGYLVGAILIWLILNVMTGAFVSQVPTLAKRLANWQNYASNVPAIGSGGATLNAIRGVGEAVEENEGGMFTAGQRDRVYDMGSLFNLGVTGRPGAVTAAVEKATRVGQKEKVYTRDAKGKLVQKEQDKPSIWAKKKRNEQGFGKQQKELRKLYETAKRVAPKISQDSGISIEKLEVEAQNIAEELINKRGNYTETELRAKVEAELRSKYSAQIQKKSAARAPVSFK